MIQTDEATKGSIEIDFGIGVQWKISIEDDGNGFYMVTFEEHQTDKGEVFCSEQLLYKDDLESLTNLIKTIKK